MKTVLNADDRWQIVCGREVCPSELFPVFNAAVVPTNKSERDMAANVAELRDFARRLRKAASLMMQSVDGKFSMTLENFSDDPARMWNKIKSDYELVSPSMKGVQIISVQTG